MCQGISTIMSGVKTLTQVNAIGKEAQFQLQEDQENIQLSQYAEDDARQRGVQGAAEAREDGSRLARTQAFLYANSGVDASVGTAANVQASTLATSEIDALTIQNNAAREAWGQARVTKRLRAQKDMNLNRSGERLNATIIGGLADGVSSAAKDK